MKSSFAVPWPQQSTNVRIISKPSLLRGALGAASNLAPAVAGRLATRLFLTPPRPYPPTPEVEALFARADDRFTVKLETTWAGQPDVARVNVTLWGRGPAVYLMHGWGGRGEQWASFIEPLVAAGVTAVTLDAPRHGRTTGTHTSLAHFAAALRAVTDSVGPARAVVAHSLGGGACAFAMERGMKAERVVIIGTPSDPARITTTFLAHVGVPSRLHPTILATMERTVDFRWSELTWTKERAIAACPLLVVHDRNDREVDYSEAEHIANVHPHAQLLTTSGLGHRRILRDASVVARVVDFVRP